MKISSEEARRRGYSPDAVAQIELLEEGAQEAEQLIQLIHQTFVVIPRPQITLHVARAYDDEWTVSEERRTELAQNDPEMDWRDVGKEKTQQFQEYFCFSDPEGWRFYLPAFMCHYLSEFPDCGWDAVYWACTELKRFEALTGQELSVVEQFVALCDKYGNIL